jgi:hypothetical protein
VVIISTPGFSGRGKYSGKAPHRRKRGGAFRAIIGAASIAGATVTTRLTAAVIAVLDAAGWTLAALLMITDADPATQGLDVAGGYAITILFVLTGLPALLLAGLNRAPRAALGLALAFPVAFVLLLIVVALILP